MDLVPLCTPLPSPCSPKPKGGGKTQLIREINDLDGSLHTMVLTPGHITIQATGPKEPARGHVPNTRKTAP